MTEREDARRAGEALRDELFGRAEAAALGNPALGFDALMAELVYANVWDRPGLARADRMAVTHGVLCAMQNHAQRSAHHADCPADDRKSTRMNSQPSCEHR